MSAIRFAVQHGQVLAGEAVYIRAESSFDFDRRTPVDEEEGAGLSGFTSLLVGTLQIEVDIERRAAVHVWGYHPREAWIFGRAVPPPFQSAEVLIASDVKLIQGVSLAVAQIGEWTTTYDDNSGWVSVRANPVRQDEQTAQVAKDTLLGLVGESLNSIWVRPVFL